MSSYIKISVAISIEVALLFLVGSIIRIFVADFDMGYIIIAQLSLMIIQVVGLILQKQEYNKQNETWEKLKKTYIDAEK